MIHRKFYAYKPIHGKNKQCKGSMFNVHDSLIVTPFLFISVSFQNRTFFVEREFGFVTPMSKQADCPLLSKPLAMIPVQYTITNYSKLWNTVIIPCCNFNIFMFTLFYSLFNKGVKIINSNACMT